MGDLRGNFFIFQSFSEKLRQGKLSCHGDYPAFPRALQDFPAPHTQKTGHFAVSGLLSQERRATFQNREETTFYVVSEVKQAVNMSPPPWRRVGVGVQPKDLLYKTT